MASHDTSSRLVVYRYPSSLTIPSKTSNLRVLCDIVLGWVQQKYGKTLLHDDDNAQINGTSHRAVDVRSRPRLLQATSNNDAAAAAARKQSFALLRTTHDKLRRRQDKLPLRETVHLRNMLACLRKEQQRWMQKNNNLPDDDDLPLISLVPARRITNSCT